MNAIETLFNNRWIRKEKNSDLYFRVRDEIEEIRPLLMEKLGYQTVVNQHVLKLEKIPAVPEGWMGIRSFDDPMDYIIFSMVLMFLEDKETGDQFVLSQLTEFVQTEYHAGTIDWKLYHHRRRLIRVLKYCVEEGILKITDGEEEGFVKNLEAEVLYESTGISRYFMRRWNFDLNRVQSADEIADMEWQGVDRDRGAARRQRVYRKLLISGCAYRQDNEEDFLYIRNFRSNIQNDMEKITDCQLEIFRDSAFLILGEESRLGRTFPEDKSESDAVLLFSAILRRELEKESESFSGEAAKEENLSGWITLSPEKFRRMLDNCKNEYGAGFSKGLRETTSAEFYRRMKSYMEELAFIRDCDDEIRIAPVLGRFCGEFPKEFSGELKTKNDNEQSTEAMRTEATEEANE